MKETRLAYIAGLIEADGGFSISKSTDARGYTHYDPLIRIKSTHLPTIKWIVSKFGGYYITSNVEGYKTAYEWKYSSDIHASRFLDSIIPFLWIKRDQAIILSRYYSLRGLICPDERSKLHIAMIVLNQSEPVTTNMSRLLLKGKNKHAYFAGVFDGEGSAYIIKIKQRNSSGYYYRSGISIDMTEPVIIIGLKKIYGGHLRSRPPHRGVLTRFEWSLKDNSSKEKFLLSVLPYLVTKRDQANAVLKFTRLNGIPNPEVREQLLLLCSELNNK